MNNAELNLFEELSTSDLQNIVGGKRGLGYHIVDAVVSFGKGFLTLFKIISDTKRRVTKWKIYKCLTL